MDPRPGTNHDRHPLDLVTMARELRVAVIDDDTERVHRLLARLRTGLVDHLRTDHRQVPAAGDALQRVVTDGQQRLLHLLDDVLSTAEEPDSCNCLLRSAEIELALRRQVAIESKVYDPSRPLSRGPAAR